MNCIGPIGLGRETVYADNRVASWPLYPKVAPKYYGHVRKCLMQEMWTGRGI
jgi:hypothetical protein